MPNWIKICKPTHWPTRVFLIITYHQQFVALLAPHLALSFTDQSFCVTFVTLFCKLFPQSMQKLTKWWLSGDFPKNSHKNRCLFLFKIWCQFHTEIIEFKCAGNLCPQGCIFVYQESHLRILPGASFYSQSHPVKFKRLCYGSWRWGASPLGSALLWSGPTCRQCSGIAEEFQKLVPLLSLFSFPCSEQEEEKGLPPWWHRQKVVQRNVPSLI